MTQETQTAYPRTLSGKRVVVLGGTSGIGFATADMAASEGAAVVIASSRRENVDRAVARLPEGAAGYAVDLRNEEQLRDFLAQLGAGESELGGYCIVLAARALRRPMSGWLAFSISGVPCENRLQTSDLAKDMPGRPSLLMPAAYWYVSKVEKGRLYDLTGPPFSLFCCTRSMSAYRSWAWSDP